MGLLFSPWGFHLPTVEALLVLRADRRAWVWHNQSGHLELVAVPEEKDELGMGRERPGGSQGHSVVQCWLLGCSKALEGSRALLQPRLGSSGASSWGSAGGGAPHPAWGEASLHPAQGEHPSPSSVLHLLGVLIASSAAPAPISLAPSYLYWAGCISSSPWQSWAAPHQCDWGSQGKRPRAGSQGLTAGVPGGGPGLACA